MRPERAAVEGVAFVWDEALTHFHLRPDHPMNPRRLELTLSLMRRMGLLEADDPRIVRPRDATDEELLTVHDARFVETVRRLSRGEAAPEAGARFGIGTEDVPVIEGMHEAARRIVGATMTAAELVMGGRARRAFSISGGMHHARRAEAAGFCIYNDLAAAIRWMNRAHGARVLYLDVDAHHGDGVQQIFYDDPEVLTLSIHESGTYLFPGTGYIDELGEGDGYGYSINVPLDVHTEDASFLAAFRAVVPDVVDAFRPDAIVLQCGCDAHYLDPLTHLRCTTGLYEVLVRETIELAERYCDGRLVVTGGGGYAIYTVVPRAWSLAWATLCGTEAPDPIPLDWLRTVRLEAGDEIPPTLRDAPDAFLPAPRRSEVEANNDRTVRAVRARALPLLRGWGLAF